MLVSLVSIAVNYATASLLIRFTGLGHAGLALSTSAVAIFGVVALFVILRKRIGGIYGRNLDREHLENHCRVGRHGSGRSAFQPRDRRLARRSPPGTFSGFGDLHPARPSGLLRRLPGSARQRTGARDARLGRSPQSPLSP